MYRAITGIADIRYAFYISFYCFLFIVNSASIWHCGLCEETFSVKYALVISICSLLGKVAECEVSTEEAS